MGNKITQQNIPEGWRLVSLGETSDPNKKWSFTGGPFGSNLKQSSYVESGVRIIQLQNIGDGIFLDKYKIFTSEEKANELLSCNIYPGEIILSKMGDPVARACIIPDIDKKYLMASDGIRLAPDNERFNTYFVFLAINSKYFRLLAENSSTGSTRKRIGLSTLRKLKLYAPNLTEQNRIVAVLKTYDQAIGILKRKIEIKKEIKKGLMQELLSGKSRIVGYSDEWVNHELEDLLKPTSEKYNPVTDNYSFKCIELEHLQKDDSELLGFTDSKLQKSIKNVFKKGDVLFGKLRPYLRKFLRTKFDGVCSTEIWVLKSSKFIESNYAYYLVQSDKFVNVANVSSGSRMPRADWGYMKSVNFTIPGKIDEQKAIVSVLDTADNEVRILIKKLSFLNNQKKYLLNNLVTGTIRTPETLSIPK